MDRELDRPLGQPASRRRSHGLALARKLAVAVALVVLVGAALAQVNFRRDLHRFQARMLSGPADGNYHATVDELVALAGAKGGRLANVESAGSVENVARLEKAAQDGCDAAFGLVQDGTPTGKGTSIELVGRLAKAESMFFLGKDADRVTEFAQLARMRVGIGPEGSGTSLLATQLFGLPELAGLGLDLSHHSNEEQIAMAKAGQLDLAVFVMDEDAPFIASAVRDGGLQIAGFAHADVIARRLPHLRTGRIGAGEYEAVRLLPATDKRVLRADTLVVANRCASHSAIIDLMTLLAQRFPDFVQHNKDTPNATGLELSSAARGFFDQGGPELADEYAPWLVDVMPPANWAYLVMAVSLLFNAMGFGHRFRLWRIDAARVACESEITQLFGTRTTLGDIQRAEAKRDAKIVAAIDRIVLELEELAARCRRYSLSIMAPMGQEMSYRYQEDLVHRTISVLRDYRRRAEGGHEAQIP